MRKYWAVFFVPVLIAISLAWLFGSGAKAGSWIAGTIGSQLSESSLIVKVHKHCRKVFVCDYFAPATSCSTPPCCKKGHREKDCGPDDGTKEKLLEPATPQKKKLLEQ